jgi:hypothetical protein
MSETQDHSRAASLTAYRLFSEGVAATTARCGSLPELTKALKHDPGLKSLRNAARAEFQSLYDNLRQHLELPKIPVYLPVRKTVAKRGSAHARSCSATELRLYPVQGAVHKDYEDWLPSDIECMTEAEMFCAFVHEVGHILEIRRHGEFSEHGEPFRQAERDVAEHLRSSGFALVMTLPLSQGPVLPSERSQPWSPSAVPAQQSWCFVATAVYGDADHEKVMVLRRFRDRRLNVTRLGRALVRLYYRLGPFLADTCKRRLWVGRMARRFLDVFVELVR